MKIEDAGVKILNELNKNGDEFTKRSELEKIRIGKNKFGEVINYLSHKRLVIVNENNTKWRISPAEGRDFLRSYKAETAQQKFNGILAITGAIIGLTAIYNFFMTFDTLKGNGAINVIFIILIFLCFISIVPFVLDYWKKEVFG